MKMGRDNVYKCTICGRYVAYRDIGTNKIITEYTPDSEFSAELTELHHKKCESNEKTTK